MTQQQWDQLQRAFGTYLGNNTYSQVSMMPQSEVEQLLKNTQSQTQSNAVNVAQKALESLQSNMPSDYSQYAAMNTQATQNYQQVIAPQEEEARKASQYYQNLVQRGPMFELAMRPELAKISPTFMGANPRDLQAKLIAEGITDPFQQQNMIQTYMQYADRSMTMSLSALGQLYDSAIIAARTAAEDKQAIYEKVADIYKEAYSATLMANKDWLESKLGTTSGEGTKDEFSVVKQIVAKHPEEWGNAANEIDTTLGPGTATKYDDYLKSVYQKGEITIENIKNQTKNTFQQYKDAGYTRDQIEKQWMADNGATQLPPLVEGVLDEIFPGTNKQWYEFWK